MRTDVRWRVAAALLLGSISAAGLRAQSAQPLQVQSMHLLAANTGWVAGERHLLRTDDNGQHWTDITPPVVGSGTIDAAFFLDARNGWVASRNEAGRLAVSITGNGGQSWVSQQVPVPLEEGASAIGIDFVDGQHGWMMVRLPSSSNFSRGRLLATADGGRTWTALPAPPIADTFRFTNRSTGWLAGGPEGTQLYVTRDGGVHWERETLPATGAVNTIPQSYRLPVFSNDRDGTLAVVMGGPRGSQVAVFETHDGGTHWTLENSTAVGANNGPIAIAVLKGGGVIAAPPNGTALVSVGKGETRTNSSFQSAIAPNEAITQLDFASDEQGWVLVSGGVCENGKTQCHQATRLLATSDAGLTVTEITPRVPASVQAAIPEAVTRGTGKGFDKCSAGTVTQMQAWWTNTPWSFANIYIGGVNRACGQPNLNAAWVEAIFKQGWKLLPTWVGLQAPGSSCSGCSKISTDPVMAAQQGTSEANGAASAAAALGLRARTIIYFDMEQYSPSSPAVRAFVNAWVEQLHRLGDVAGVYGAGSNAAADWAPIANPPDAVWIANWNGNPSVFGLSGLPDSLWPNHQRLHQYQGGHNETWGGVTFNIDSDSADGPLAGPSTNDGSIWQFTGTSCNATSCPGWRELDNNVLSTQIAASGNNLYQLQSDGSIWGYTGTPCSGNVCWGWQRLDNNGAASALAADGSMLYQLRGDGSIWSYTGTPCSGNTCSGWQQLDTNPSAIAITAANGNLYQLQKTGEIWQYMGRPCSGNLCPGWQKLDDNPGTIAVAAGGRRLYQLRQDGSLWRYSGNPCVGAWCPVWEELDNRPGTTALAAGSNVYELHSNGEIWVFTGAPCDGNSCSGWRKLDNNPLSFAIAAAGGDLYQLNRNGEVWQYVGIPCTGDTCTGWKELDNNPNTTRIAVGGGNLYELH